jgi:hypothetical protein
MDVSRRDYFAGLAMQAMVTDYLKLSPLKAVEGKECISEYAYEIADAMLRERKNKVTEDDYTKPVNQQKSFPLRFLERKVAWAADQFEAIENAIAANSVGYAQAHAQRCAAEMTHDTDLSEETEN